MKRLYLDESGDHNLLLIDSQYPVFVLGGIVVDADYADGPLQERVQAFKQRMFGRRDLVLHTADIARNRRGFERLADPSFRQDFYAELNALIADLSFGAIACVIRKRDHRDLYGDAAVDPYMLSLNVLVERFCREIENGETGTILAERRDAILDAQLRLAWQELTTGGTYRVAARTIRRKISTLDLRTKADGSAGLELADLVVSPIGRHVLGKATKEDFRIIERKFRRNASGEYRGHGLVELPKRKPAPATQ